MYTYILHTINAFMLWIISLLKNHLILWNFIFKIIHLITFLYKHMVYYSIHLKKLIYLIFSFPPLNFIFIHLNNILNKKSLYIKIHSHCVE